MVEGLKQALDSCINIFHLYIAHLHTVVFAYKEEGRNALNVILGKHL